MKKITALLWAFLFVSCQHSPLQNIPSEKTWDQYIQGYMLRYFAVHPDIAVAAGKHEYDGKLPDWSESSLKNEIQRLEKEKETALKFAPSFERSYLIATIENDLFLLRDADLPHRNPSFYGSALDPNIYVSMPYAPPEHRLKALIQYVKNVPLACEQIRSNLQTPMPETFSQLGSLSMGGLADYLEKDVPEAFKTISDPKLLEEYKIASLPAIAAFRKINAWFIEQHKSPGGSFVLGEELYKKMLKMTEEVDLSISELEKIAKSELERNLADLKIACKKFAPGKNLKDCVMQEELNKPKNGPVYEARMQLHELKKFLLKTHIVSIPSKQEALVNESPPYMRWNSAYIQIPGPYDLGMPSTYYIAPPDPKWSKKEQDEYIPGWANLLSTSVHEVWPGHFLQFLHANRSHSKFGQIFLGYAFTEGWAHYAEEMMWEAGFKKDNAEFRVGQILNALLRTVRFLSSVGLHTRGMTVAESEKLFMESGLQDPGTAKQQASRGTFDPGYLKYTLGKLMIKKLRNDWCASRGGRKCWGKFHDQFLSYGGPPIPLVREAMMKTRDGLL